MYMSSLRQDFTRLGLRHVFSAVDTDQAVAVNAGRLHIEISELADELGADGRVVLLCHSKGGVDAAAALSLFPELQPRVAALVTMQSPHSGSAIAHDLANTELQRNVAIKAIEKLLHGSKHAVLDLSYDVRRSFMAQHPYPTGRVPTLCVGCSERRPGSLLRPTINYIGEWRVQPTWRRPTRRVLVLALSSLPPTNCRSVALWRVVRWMCGPSRLSTPGMSLRSH